MNITAVILLVLKASIIASVFAIGLKATFADATFLFRRPGHLLRALLSMNVLMPLVALGIGAPFDLHPTVKIALVVISVSPTPPILPKRALKAGGAEAYTIGLLAAVAVLSVVVVPLSMEIFERITGVALVMRARDVAALVLTTILVPLLAGSAVRHVAHAVADRVAGPIGVLASVLLLVCGVPVAIGLARTVVSLIGDGTILSLAGFALAGLIMGHLLGGPEPDNRPVLALATASRHPAVAMAIAHANFPEQRLAAAAVFLFLILGGLLSALYLSWVKRQRAGRTPDSFLPSGKDPMRIRARSVMLSAVVVAVLAPSAEIHGQEATSSPHRGSSGATAATLKQAADIPAAQAAVAKPGQASEPDILHREELTGDWNGRRTRWKNKGVEVASSLTQFYQGVASGGTDTDAEYNGTAQAELRFDFGKLAGWQFWSAEIKAETRFGGPLLSATGTISPVNTSAIIPGADGTVFSVTAVNATKLFPINLKEGKLFAVSFGRYNLVDLVDEDFFAGGGTERFFNIAQIGPLTVVREMRGTHQSSVLSEISSQFQEECSAVPGRFCMERCGESGSARRNFVFGPRTLTTGCRPIVFVTTPPQPASKARMMLLSDSVGGADDSRNGFVNRSPVNVTDNCALMASLFLAGDAPACANRSRNRSECLSL